MIQHAFAFERAVVNPYNLVTVLLPTYLSYLVMAMLVQLPRTGIYRTAFLPMVFWLSYRTAISLDFSLGNPGYAHMNHAMASALFSYAMRCSTWAFVERPYSRLPTNKLSSGITNGDKKDTIANNVSVSSTVWNAVDLVVYPRCIGWAGPPDVPIAKPYFQVDSRLLFALLSFCRFILLAIVFDILIKFVQWLGADSFGRPAGGTIFDPSLPPIQRYLRSSIISILCGFAIYVAIDLAYQLHAAVAVTFLGHRPSQWPPLFDSPWLATSVSNFWGRRWHQLCREYFVGMGSKPLEKYLGRLGGIIGAFFISGVMHDVAVRGMYQATNSLSVTGFFVVQGVGVVIEHAWKKVTGRRVRGFVGWLWTLLWLVFWGNIAVDAWAKSGLLGGELCPDDWSPALLLLNRISRK